MDKLPQKKGRGLLKGLIYQHLPEREDPLEFPSREWLCKEAGPLPLPAPHLPSSLSTKAPAAPPRLRFLIRAEGRLTLLFRGQSLWTLSYPRTFPSALEGASGFSHFSTLLNFRMDFPSSQLAKIYFQPHFKETREALFPWNFVGLYLKV